MYFHRATSKVYQGQYKAMHFPAPAHLKCVFLFILAAYHIVNKSNSLKLEATSCLYTIRFALIGFFLQGEAGKCRNAKILPPFQKPLFIISVQMPKIELSRNLV